MKLKWNDTTWLGIRNDLAENRPWKDIQRFCSNLPKIFGGCIFRMIFITHILYILQLLLKKGFLNNSVYWETKRPQERLYIPCPLTFDRTHQGGYQGRYQLQTKQASKVERRKLFDTLLAYLETFGRWVFLILMVLNSPNLFVATRRVPLQSKNVTGRVE